MRVRKCPSYYLGICFIRVKNNKIGNICPNRYKREIIMLEYSNKCIGIKRGIIDIA